MIPFCARDRVRDVVLSDVPMPGKDGLEVIDEIWQPSLRAHEIFAVVRLIETTCRVIES